MLYQAAKIAEQSGHLSGGFHTVAQNKYEHDNDRKG